MKEKHPLQKMQIPMIGQINYRGTLVTRLIGGWEWNGKKFTDPHQVDKAIEEAARHLNKSIKQ